MHLLQALFQKHKKIQDRTDFRKPGTHMIFQGVELVLHPIATITMTQFLCKIRYVLSIRISKFIPFELTYYYEIRSEKDIKD